MGEVAFAGNIRIVPDKGGQILGYSSASGIKLILKDGFAFEDLNLNGQLDVHED